MRIFLPIIFMFICLNGSSQILDEPASDLSSWYKVSSENNLLGENHLYTKSPGTSVGTNLHHFGFGPIIAPPYFCYPFAVHLEIFNIKIKANNYNWYPSTSVYKGESINGISSQFKVTPIATDRGVIAEVELTNNNKNEVLIPIDWIIEGQVGSSVNWEWYPPAAMHSKKEDTKISREDQTLILANDTFAVLLKVYGHETVINNNKISSVLKINPGGKKSFGIVIIPGSNRTNLHKSIDSICAYPLETLANTRKISEKLIEATESEAPGLEGGSEALTSFYKKGLITYLTCRWEVPEFALHPWYAESGIDGGALNNYYWGIAYISRLMSVMEPAVVRELLLLYVNADLANSYAINPANGKGMGVLYSYNYYSIARATYDYVTVTGDISILTEKVKNETYLEYIYRFCLSKEDLLKDPVLIDYGGNHNLLELKLTNDYTNFTPSPNAERLLIYHYLTGLFKWSGKPIPHDLTLRGEKLKSVFQEKLWDSKNDWLFCLDYNEQKLTAYSIQIFDVLRTGILTKNQEKALVKHLKDKEFLSPWGVYSLALTDEGYDRNDVDWGGPGVYAGDAPELIEDLIHSGYEKEGIDLLNRILWWGEFPYYPQAIRADKKGCRENGRPNVISGLATTQCVIFGLFGIQVNENSIIINPVNNHLIYGVSLKGLKLRGETIDIYVENDGKAYTVKWGNNKIYKPIDDVTIIKVKDIR